MSQNLIGNQNIRFDIINITKIVLLIFISFSILAYFYPYHTDNDSLVYGVTTISLANGSYEYSNKLLKETGLWEFVPVQWVKTVHDTAVPKTGVGIYGFSTIAYLLGGYYGLFYVGPILSIVFLIVAERIATNLFGRLVGLITLIFLVSDFTILIIARQLMTDNIFSLFFILGCFFLIKFFKEKKSQLILFSSIFFVITAFIRVPGIIFLPIEFSIIIGYFAYEKFWNKKNNSISKNLDRKNNTNLHNLKFFNMFKIGFFFVIPWMIFILFFFGFNSYNFGDPLTTYQDVSKPEEFRSGTKTSSGFFQFDLKFLEFTKFYSSSLLPDVLRDSLMTISSTHNLPQFEKTWIGLFSLLIFIPSILLAFYHKIKRKEVIIFCLFIAAWISFHSSNYVAPSIENPPTPFLRDRYMIPMLPLFFILFGFVIDRILKFKDKGISFNLSKWSISNYQIFIIILVSILLFTSIYSSKAVADIANKQTSIHNPSIVAERYPIDLEGLSENSIIVGGASRKVLEYNLTSFFPYWGIGRYTEVNENTIPQKSIQTLKKLMEDGYETYMFKGGSEQRDIPYFKILENEYGIFLQNYSKTFCKLEMIDSKNDLSDPTEFVSDGICYLSTSTEVQCIGGKCFSVEIEWTNTREFYNP